MALLVDNRLVDRIQDPEQGYKVCCCFCESEQYYIPSYILALSTIYEEFKKLGRLTIPNGQKHFANKTQFRI